MTETLDSPETSPAGNAGMPDVAPLAWVVDEIRSSLAQSVAALKGFLGNKADIDALRSAAEQVHQVSGALQLLDLRGVSLVTEAVEQLFAQWESEPGQCLPAAVRSVDNALVAVRNYLDALMIGRAVPPVRLFPYYREILALLRAPRVHPADLLFPDLSRRPAFDRMPVRALSVDELRIRRVLYEDGLLQFLRNPDDAAARKRMREAVHDLEGLPQRGLARTFWWVTAALFDALESFQVPVDADLKRFLARLNSQLRRLIEGGAAVAERLMVDGLYHIGTADEHIERVAQVKQLYGLGSLLPADFDRPSLNAQDAQALAALHESLTQCKLLWGQVAASNPPEPTRFRAEVARAQQSAQQLGAAASARVLGCIAECTSDLAHSTPAVREVLGMEIATALLLLETGADGGPTPDPQFGARADALIARIVHAATGQALPEGDAWVAELAQRAQDRSSMSTVVTEMRALLREAELRLDRFFRNPAQRGELPELLPMLDEVAGVLAVLGFEDPTAALRNAHAAVERFLDPATPPDPEQFARIAQNLGAVGFFVGGLTEQPAAPRGLFAFDQRSGVFSANMAQPPAPRVENLDDVLPQLATGAAREPANVEHSIERLLTAALRAADEIRARPSDPVALEQLAAILAELTNDAELTDDNALRTRVSQAGQLLDALRRGGSGGDAAALQALLRPAEAAVPALTAPLPASKSAADRELHEIFVEEADEVLESVTAQLERLRADPADGATITMARRAFHTLKGSSRMVGLRDFGEFAWALEQCFNVWLAQERPANDDLLGLASASADRMRDWIEALRADPHAHIDASAFIHAAHVVRDGGAFALPYSLDANQIVDPQTPTIEVMAAPPPSDDDGGDAPAAPGYDTAPAGVAQDAPQGAADAPADDTGSGDDMRRIGPLAISHGLYSVFLTESDECIRALGQDIGEWRYEANREVSEPIVRRAHTLAGISDTVGLTPVCALADPLDALMRHLYDSRGGEHQVVLDAAQFDVLERVVERIRGMLHQFAAGMYPEEAPLEAGALRDLLAMQRSAVPVPVAPAGSGAGLGNNAIGLPQNLFGDGGPAQAAPESGTHQGFDLHLAPVADPFVLSPAEPANDAQAPMDDAATAAPGDWAQQAPLDGDDAFDDSAAAEVPLPAAEPVRDDIDSELLQVFTLEAHDLMPSIARGLRTLLDNPNQRDAARDLMRNLHTFKGSARMAGAMRLGEVVHEMETRLEAAMESGNVPSAVIEDLQGQFDQAQALFEGLANAGASGSAAATPAAAAPAAPAPKAAVWTTNPVVPIATAGAAPAAAPATNVPFIRVRADVVDRLVDHAGEVSIARSKLESEVGTLRGSVADLTENIQRLRAQLREVELQADAQFQARSDQVAKQSSSFDPLEFDRYSRLQELTRQLAESVEDVALVQSNMVKGLQLADNDLTAQSRLTRDLQQQLMRVRLVPFSNVSERLYRVARQAAKELRKQVHLDIVGAETEIDRSLLEQMAGPFEHLVRNAIVHGLELPAQRHGAGKSDTGELRIEVRREGNEIVVVFADDGAGLDLERIRARAISTGLLSPERRIEEREVIDLIFRPGLSTAREVTELAGRGIGMDVVREQVTSLGGRIAVSTHAGSGTRFTLYLPMSLSILQVVLATVGTRRYALPAAMVEQARRMRGSELAAAVQNGTLEVEGIGPVTLRPLTQLLGLETAVAPSDQYGVALLRLGEDRLAISADELSTNQEVVVKNVGPQVARLAGVLGATVMGNGEVVLIINPVQFISRAPEPALLDLPGHPADEGTAGSESAPGGALAGATVMVVDDSLTVRRVTQRLLERNGYRTMLAKDGVDALRALQDHQPDVMLVDIEMPRMDGYDLTRNVRNSAATRHIPIIMITSRTAEKHRRVAFELGVNEYLGKPYREDELLELVRRYVETARAVRAANESA